MTHTTGLGARQRKGPKARALGLPPVATYRFDAVELVRWWVRGGYRGRYLALAQSEPNISLIRNEIQGHAPKLNFDVVAMDGRSALHSV